MKHTPTALLFCALCFVGNRDALGRTLSSYLGMAGETDRAVTLTIKPDGSSILSSENTQPRCMLEFQLHSWARYEAAAEGEEIEAPTPPPAAENKSYTDEELEQKLRAMYERRSGYSGATGIEKLEKIVITTNSVQVLTTQAFASLNELAGAGLWSWGPTALMPENARLEMLTNGQFQLLFTPAKLDARYLKSITQQLKARKVKQSWKLELPGKIVSSSFPASDGGSTWIDVDTSKPESIETTLKLIGTNLAIVAEAGGLKLDAPIDVNSMSRNARQTDHEADGLPITDAGPGFVTEAQNITITTLYHFSDAAKRTDSTSWSGMRATGTVIAAKLFPPKGRQILSISDVRVIKAVDDKGRPVVNVAGDDRDDPGTSVRFDADADASVSSGAAQFDLKLGLPESDAQAIDSLEAEAVAQSISGWRELVVPDLQADKKKEIDLSELLPGAKLIIDKINARQSQTTISAKLVGPPAISQFDVKIKSTERGSSHFSERRLTRSGDTATRSFTLQAYDFGSEERKPRTTPTLIVRQPLDAKRERVKFSLSALDLL